MIEALFIGIVGIMIVAVPVMIMQSLASATWRGLKAIKRRCDHARDRRRQAAMQARARADQHRRDMASRKQSRLRDAQRRRNELIASRNAELVRRRAAGDQRRRNDARAKCECRWSLYEPHIRNRFARADFERFVGAFMTDGHSAEEVEARATQLLHILDTFYAAREDAQPAQRFRTLEDVTAWFNEQKVRIERLPIDEQTRDEHLARLHGIYAELSDRILEVAR